MSRYIRGQTMADGQTQRGDCRVAYLVSEFPAVSHTFIAREIDALRARGVDVVTMSIRKTPAERLLSDADRRAADETFTVFPLRKARFVAAHLRAVLARPGRYLATLRLALEMSPGGARANLWQFFYFAESILVWSQCRRGRVRHIHAHFANVASAVALLAAEFGEPDGTALELHHARVHGVRRSHAIRAGREGAPGGLRVLHQRLLPVPAAQAGRA